MKIRMRQQISGTRNGRKWPEPGKTIDVSDREGATLCAGGAAEPVATKAKTSKAVAKKAETRG